jgi:Asp-tRNA(Asn)/Glu-tRNA(Gln) amidotransferase A subunit family amidase
VLNVPAGLSPDGVPIGMSVVARTYDDVTAFRVAAAHEQQLGWWADGGPRPAV